MDAVSEQSADVPRAKRGSQTVADMVRSLGLVLLVVALALVLGPGRALLFPSRNERALPIDYRSVIEQAGLRAGLPLRAPAPLPAGWSPNAARVDGARGSVTLHVGFVTPAKEYVALDEAQRSAAAWVASVLGAPARDTGPATQPAGWQLWRTNGGHEALVREQRGVVVVVSGTDHADMVRLAGSVR